MADICVASLAQTEMEMELCCGRVDLAGEAGGPHEDKHGPGMFIA